MKGLVDKLRGQALLERLAAQDSEAFAEVYDLYVDRIFRYVVLKLPTQEDAEDVSSEVFKRLWQYVCDGTKVVDNLNALIYQIARNLVADYYRNRERKPTVSADDFPIEIADERQLDVVRSIEHGIELTQAIQQLPTDYREVVVLRYIEDLSTEDIAQIMGRTKGAIRVLLHRATQLLRQHLSHHDPARPQSEA